MTLCDMQSLLVASIDKRLAALSARVERPLVASLRHATGDRIPVEGAGNSVRNIAASPDAHGWPVFQSVVGITVETE